MVFASNPPLWKEMFQKDERDEFDIEEFEPQTEEDVAEMMADLRRMGLT